MPVLALYVTISIGNCNQCITSSCDDSYEDVFYACVLKSYDVFFFFRKAYLLAFNVLIMLEIDFQPQFVFNAAVIQQAILWRPWFLPGLCYSLKPL